MSGDETFKYGLTDKGLANALGQYIEIYHLPTDQSVKFKAYLTTFTDQYQSNWNSEEVFGRMDPIQTFKGTKRTISLGWDVPASSYNEANENLIKASLLVSMLYPTYNNDGSGRGGASTIAAPPLFKIKFMNLIQDSAMGAASVGADARTGGLLGTIGGFTYEPDLESGFFNPIGHFPETYESHGVPFSLSHGTAPIVKQADIGKLFPQTIKFQCEFTVLHQHALGWDEKGARKGFGKFPYSNGHESPTKADGKDPVRPPAPPTGPLRETGGEGVTVGPPSPFAGALAAERKKYGKNKSKTDAQAAARAKRIENLPERFRSYAVNVRGW